MIIFTNTDDLLSSISEKSSKSSFLNFVDSVKNDLSNVVVFSFTSLLLISSKTVSFVFSLSSWIPSITSVLSLPFKSSSNARGSLSSLAFLIAFSFIEIVLIKFASSSAVLSLTLWVLSSFSSLNYLIYQILYYEVFYFFLFHNHLL